MTQARSKLVDPTLTRWYHCVSRCVRQAFLLAEGISNRKTWLEDRMRELTEIFAVSVAGFAILDNHLHVLLRLDPTTADSWTDAEVVRRWFKLCPPRSAGRKVLQVSEELIAQRLLDTEWVTTIRARLQSLSWFMKCLKEPLARMANKEDECAGAFFEGRFKSIAVLDEVALLSACAYIDLNPVAAGVAETPEESQHTSVKQRIDNVKRQGREADCGQAEIGSFQATTASAKLEEPCWLVPIEDRRSADSTREGVLRGFTLGNYLMLVDYTGRFLRDGKASVSSELAPILQRIGSSSERWLERLRLLSHGKLLGSFFSTCPAKLKAAASLCGSRYVVNLSGCPT